MIDPLHDPGLPTTHWTTGNVGEALPGVATPLGWTVWEAGADRMCRELFHALGVYGAREAQGPGPGEDPIVRVFHGRIAMQLEWLATAGDRMPGTTGDEAVRGMVGGVPDTLVFRPTRGRYPVIAGKLPAAALRSPRVIRDQHAEIERWWQAQVAALPEAGEDAARAALRDGAARFRRAMTLHGIALFSLVTPMTDVVSRLVARTGVGDLGALSGTGGAEMAIVADIWAASRGRLPVADVAARHGYHGPLEGEISSRVWREDPAPLQQLIERYARRPEADDPAHREARAREALPRLQAELVAELPRAARPAAGAALRLAARTIPLRGVGKVSFVQALDVCRAAARRLGEHLDLGDDVFYLTLDELLGPVGDVAAVIAERRARRAEHQAVRLPEFWRGSPVPERDEPPAPTREVRGIPASGGVVEGRVRVVTDPSFAEVEDGEILVSQTTDPSWASIMFVSAALVVDVGGLISHAAVVARELGIPCVVNTRDGTRVLRDGDRVRVDGTAGTVTVLEP